MTDTDCKILDSVHRPGFWFILQHDHRQYTQTTASKTIPLPTPERGETFVKNKKSLIFIALLQVSSSVQQERRTSNNFPGISSMTSQRPFMKIRKWRPLTFQHFKFLNYLWFPWWISLAVNQWEDASVLGCPGSEGPVLRTWTRWPAVPCRMPSQKL